MEGQGPRPSWDGMSLGLWIRVHNLGLGAEDLTKVLLALDSMPWVSHDSGPLCLVPRSFCMDSGLTAEKYPERLQNVATSNTKSKLASISPPAGLLS